MFFWQVSRFLPLEINFLKLTNTLIKWKLSSLKSLSKKQSISKINNNKKVTTDTLNKSEFHSAA